MENLYVIDSHVHIGLNSFFKSENKSGFNLENDYHSYLEVMNRNGIAKAVILPIPIKGIDYYRSNEYIWEAYTSHPDRFIPFGLMDGNMDHWIKTGFKGFKEHTRLEENDEDAYIPYYLKLEEHDLPLMLHPLFQNKVKRVKSILKVAPRLKIILSHMGRGHLWTDEDVVKNMEALKKYENVYFETSTIRLCRAIENAVNIVGADRILFGTDYPFARDMSEKNSVEIEKNVILKAKITVTDKEEIFYKNITKLIK